MTNTRSIILEDTGGTGLQTAVSVKFDKNSFEKAAEKY
jgi:hypothetical protein